MKIDERKAKVEKIIKDEFYRVLGGSIQATSLASIVNGIDNVYLPHLKEEEPVQQ